MKTIKTLLMLLVLALPCVSQSTKIRSVTSLPATCAPGDGIQPADMVALSSVGGGGTTTLYYCRVINTWAAIGGQSATGIQSSTTFTVPGAVTTLNAYGDSITAGSNIPNAVTTSTWGNLVAVGWGLPLGNNFATAGSRFSQNGLVASAYLQSPSTSVGSIGLIGTNDITADGSTATLQKHIGWAAQAMMVWLSIPSSQRTLATSLTQGGSWSTTTDFNLTSVFSNVANNTLTGTTTGTAVYVAGAWGTGVNMSFDVLIDGSSACGANCIVTYDLTAPTGHYPWCLRFSGLSSGSHTVVIKNITGGGANYADIQWIAGNGSTPPGIFAAFGGAMQHTGVANANITGTNSQFSTIATNLATDGLTVYYIDDYSAIATANTPSDYATDNLHPNTLGNQLIAAKWFSTLGVSSITGNSVIAELIANNAAVYPSSVAGVAGQTLLSQAGSSNGVPFFTTQAYQAKRAASCTTGSTAASTCTTTVTWVTAFADTSYTATCVIDAPTNVPYVIGTSSKAAGTIVVTIANLTAAAASGTLNCFAIHD